MWVLLLLAGLEVTSQGEQLVVVNKTAVEVVGLRAGDATLERLAPGASWAPPTTDPPTVGGRFPLAAWSTALADLDHAELHLRTAGFYLDAVHPGDPGEANAANLEALRTVDPAVAASWAEAPPLRLALAARAARYVPPGPLLSRLMERVQPSVEPPPSSLSGSPPWPEAYQKLDALPDLVRTAIERHGPASLDVLLAAPAWAADRGISVPLSAAWGRKVTAPPFDAEALSSALSQGDRERAAELGVAAALSGDRGRLACAALDLGVQTHLGAGRLLAAEGHLRLAARVCPAQAPLRQRAAELTRTRGERAFRSGDLRGAAEWFRAGWWIASERADQGRLADTLAELALLRYERKENEAGNAWLDQARAVEAIRPRVMDAFAARPTADPRVRIALGLIILVMALVVLRRLRRMRKDRPESLSKVRRRLRR